MTRIKINGIIFQRELDRKVSFMEENSTVFRIFERDAEDKNNCIVRGRTKIGIVPMANGAGAGFTALNLVKATAERDKLKPAFLDFSGQLYYYQLAMDKRFDKRGFINMIARGERGENLRNISNWEEGINWCIYKPDHIISVYARNADSLASFELYKIRSIMQEQLEGDFSISVFPYLGMSLVKYDDPVATSGMLWRDWKRLLEEQDYIIFIIDPKPDRLISGKAFLEEIKKIEPQKIYVINKDNSGVNRPEVKRFLDVKKTVSVPQVYREYIYKAEYACKIPWNVSEIRSILYSSINEIIDEMEL